MSTIGSLPLILRRAGSNPSRPGPRTVQPPPTLSHHTDDTESSSRRTPWNSLRYHYGLLGWLCLVPGTLMIWWKCQCFHLIIMGVALDVHVTGTLAAVEEHERGYAHWLHNLLPEDLQRDLSNGDEDELALTLLDITEPLQYPLSVLQTDTRSPLRCSLMALGVGRCHCWSWLINTRRHRRSYQR